jgi:hypothetical protein
MSDLFDPQPGEVWICVKRTYTKPNPNVPRPGGHELPTIEDYIRGPDEGEPFIVLWLSKDQIGVVYAPDRGTEPVLDSFWRAGHSHRPWHWLEHFERLWPAVPSWSELQADNEQRVAEMAEAERKRREHRPDDLRAVAQRGNA